MFSLELIAAVAANGVIGRNGQLPWHLPADLQYFKTTTSGHPILMGRKTWESVGRPLPRRRNIIVSSKTPPTPGIEVVPSLNEALKLVSHTEGPVFVVGGHALYAEALPRASVLHLTEIEDPFEGDATFPDFDRSQWKLAASSRQPKDEKHAHAFSINRYLRI